MLQIMRTTLTLEDTIDRKLRKIAERQRISYKDAVNMVLSRGLQVMEAHEAPIPYEARIKDYCFQPGIDQDRLNQLVDELEVE